jgi:ribulose-phosphate 3-epimerase
MSIPIVPAIIPESAEQVRSLVTMLRSAREVQIDVVDGQYVTNVSWPYIPHGDPAEVRRATDQVTLEVDLMVKDPLPAARAWIAAGADMVVFHQETISFEAFAAFVESSSVSVGIASRGPIDALTVHPYIAVADYVQLMGVRTIGAQGNPFDESVLSRISELKRAFPSKMISVDGGVNAATIPLLKQAGANRLIVGSAIMKQPDPLSAYVSLAALVND